MLDDSLVDASCSVLVRQTPPRLDYPPISRRTDILALRMLLSETISTSLRDAWLGFRGFCEP
jgi:hypothetical protein